jgi:hypothetical protein
MQHVISCMATIFNKYPLTDFSQFCSGTCPPRFCPKIRCLNGYVLDANGCRTCKCKRKWHHTFVLVNAIFIFASIKILKIETVLKRCTCYRLSPTVQKVAWQMIYLFLKFNSALCPVIACSLPKSEIGLFDKWIECKLRLGKIYFIRRGAHGCITNYVLLSVCYTVKILMIKTTKNWLTLHVISVGDL